MTADQTNNLIGQPYLKALSTQQVLEAGIRTGDATFDGIVTEWATSAGQDEMMAAFASCRLQDWRTLTPLPSSLRQLETKIEGRWHLPMDDGSVKLAKGFFEEHKSAVFLVLGTYGLPYCYQSAEGAATLLHSKRLHTDPLARLAETAQFIDAVFSEKSPFGPSSQLTEVLLRVRLVHTLVRMMSARHRPEYVAINQTELLGTGLSFSMVVLRGLRKMGIAISPQVTEAWLQIWNNISNALGVDKVLLPPDAKAAWATEQRIAKLCFSPSDQANALTQSLCAALDANLMANNVGAQLVPKASQMLKFFLGDQASVTIGIAPDVLPATSWQLSLMAQYLKWQYAKMAS